MPIEPLLSMAWLASLLLGVVVYAAIVIGYTAAAEHGRIEAGGADAE